MYKIWLNRGDYWGENYLRKNYNLKPRYWMSECTLTTKGKK
jgi:hypothetical protein